MSKRREIRGGLYDDTKTIRASTYGLCSKTCGFYGISLRTSWLPKYTRIRGGSSDSFLASSLRTANRNSCASSETFSLVGFRMTKEEIS